MLLCKRERKLKNSSLITWNRIINFDIPKLLLRLSQGLWRHRDIFTNLNISVGCVVKFFLFSWLTLPFGVIVYTRWPSLTIWLSQNNNKLSQVGFVIARLLTCRSYSFDEFFFFNLTMYLYHLELHIAYLSRGANYSKNHLHY